MIQPPIDKAHGMRWCHQDEALWQRLLASFYRQFARYREPTAILSAQQARQLAHDVKNSALPCGAVALHQQAQVLAPSTVVPTERQIASLLALLNEVLAYLEVHFHMDEPSSNLERGTTHPLFEALWQQLEQHNFKALALFEQCLTRCKLDWPTKTIDDIRLALHSFNFQQAKSLLQAATEQYGSPKPSSQK